MQLSHYPLGYLKMFNIQCLRGKVERSIGLHFNK